MTSPWATNRHEKGSHVNCNGTRRIEQDCKPNGQSVHVGPSPALQPGLLQEQLPCGIIHGSEQWMYSHALDPELRHAYGCNRNIKKNYTYVWPPQLLPKTSHFSLPRQRFIFRHLKQHMTRPRAKPFWPKGCWYAAHHVRPVKPQLSEYERNMEQRKIASGPPSLAASSQC